MNQTERKTMFTQQNDECALCAAPHKVLKGMCYTPEQNVLICRPCSTYLHSYRAAIKRGITPDALIAFLERKPTPRPSPGTETMATTKKLTLHQLDSLQMLLNGQTELSMIEWCQRAGVTEAEAMQQIADR